MRFPTKFILDVLMHVVLVAVFLGIFFFSYVTWIENSLVKRQTTELVHDTMAQLSVWMPQYVRDSVNDAVRNIKYPDLAEEDRKVQEHNSEIIHQAIFSLGMLAGIVVVIMVIFYFLPVRFVGIVPWRELLQHNGILLLVTALVEFTFLTGFVQWYRLADVSDFKLTFLKTLQTWAESPPLN